MGASLNTLKAMKAPEQIVSASWNGITFDVFESTRMLELTTAHCDTHAGHTDQSDAHTLTEYGHSKDVIEPFLDVFAVLGKGVVGCCSSFNFYFIADVVVCHQRCWNSVVVHHHYLLCIVSAPDSMLNTPDGRFLMRFFVSTLPFYITTSAGKEERISPRKVRHKLYNALGIVVSACSKIIFQSNFMTFRCVHALCIFLSRIIYL